MEEQSRYRWIADHVLPFEREVRRWLRRKARTLSSADIDDLVQEAYARLWTRDFSIIGDGRKFFYTVVLNVWQDQLRRARVVQIERFEDAGSLHVDKSPGPEQRVSARQQFERLVQVVKQMPPKRRAVFEAKQFAGLSTREIARRMNIAEKTAEMHLRYALVQVTKSMLDDDDVRADTLERDGTNDLEVKTKQD